MSYVQLTVLFFLWVLHDSGVDSSRFHKIKAHQQLRSGLNMNNQLKWTRKINTHWGRFMVN